MHIERIGQGPDLVLLHGWGLNSAVWQEIVPLLAPYYSLHLVDLPGFGFSQHVAVESAELSLWSEVVLPHLPAQFNLLGWSMGGLIALRMARVNVCRCVESSPNSPTFWYPSSARDGIDMKPFKIYMNYLENSLTFPYHIIAGNIPRSIPCQ
jgi:pimeloyl-[acyl-carrier protein] methyl ester esterase